RDRQRSPRSCRPHREHGERRTPEHDDQRLRGGAGLERCGEEEKRGHVEDGAGKEGEGEAQATAPGERAEQGRPEPGEEEEAEGVPAPRRDRGEAGGGVRGPRGARGCGDGRW